jgi:hypothetical protein
VAAVAISLPGSPFDAFHLSHPIGFSVSLGYMIKGDAISFALKSSSKAAVSGARDDCSTTLPAGRPRSFFH